MPVDALIETVKVRGVLGAEDTMPAGRRMKMAGRGWDLSHINKEQQPP